MNSIVVLAKSPRPGRVKTRLCPPCTFEQAAAIARAAIVDTLATVARVDVGRRVLALDGAIGNFVPTGFDVVPQCEGSLDLRLAHAFASCDGPTLLIGMDTPQVSVRQLTDALRYLSRPEVDAVLGSAYDGGWWGLGLCRPDPAALVGVPMSTAHTGAAQAARLQQLGLRTHALPTLLDVDYYEDATAVAALMPTSHFAHAVASVGLTVPA